MTATITASPTSVATPIPPFIAGWYDAIPTLATTEAFADAGRTAIFCTDMIVGFCRKGALSSTRVGALAGPVADLFQTAYDSGVRRFVLTQDTHDPRTPEFQAWPVHCVRGTDEAETIPELATLPFADHFTIFEKNGLSPHDGTGFDDWLDANADLTTAIVAGNCTDLCVYQLAMHLRVRANALNRAPFEVIVPANVVDTYDLPPAEAIIAGVTPHPGDFFHQTFLYHMALNGIRVVRALT